MRSQRDLEHIEAIYQAALTFDRTVLNDALVNAKAPNLTVLSTYYIEPALTRLIDERRIDAVDFFIFNVNNEYLDSSITAHVPSGYIHRIAHQAAAKGYRDFCEKLRINKNADITLIACGAIKFGDHEYTETLVYMGADIPNIVGDAAAVGDFDYVEELLTGDVGALNYLGIAIPFITYAGRGAAEGGHLKKAREFIDRGADIDWVAAGAGDGGFLQFADELISRGANMRYVGSAAHASGYHDYVEELQIRWLVNRFTTYQQMFDFLTRGQHAPSVVDAPIKDETLRKAEKVIALKTRYGGLTDQEALSLLYRNNSGALIYLCAFATFPVSKLQAKTELPHVILNAIFQFNFGFGGNPCVSKTAGFGLFLSRNMPRRNAGAVVVNGESKKLVAAHK